MVAILYLITLALTLPFFWALVIIGGNPLTVQNVAVTNVAGAAHERFRAGEVAVVRRTVCSRSHVGAEFFPALRGPDGVLFPLPGGYSQVSDGCRPSAYGFIVPALPPGRYTYSNMVKFQNNLIGRDEHTSFPPLTIEVAP